MMTCSESFMVGVVAGCGLGVTILGLALLWVKARSERLNREEAPEEKQ